MQVIRFSAPPAGSDESKPPIGYRANRDSDVKGEQENFIEQLDSYREAIAHIRATLRKSGYALVAEPLGEWGGFRVYERSTLSIPGLTCPRDWGMYRALTPNGDGSAAFIASFKLAATALLNGESPKSVKERVVKFYLAIVDRPRDTKSVAYSASQGFYNEDDLKRTLSGANDCHKVVPPLEWFSDDLQRYDTRELLTVFPDAEAEIFMLTMGKMLAGSSGTKTIEGTLEYFFRGLIHLIDPQGGIGKSWLLSQISNTLGTLGYTTGVIDPRMREFSHINWVGKDFTMLDDANVRNLQSVLLNGVMKSAATNADSIFAEAKGVQGQNVKVNTTVFIASNCSNIYTLYEKMDTAQMSRHIPVQLFTQKELELVHGNGWEQFRLPEYWGNEAKRLGVKIETLFMLFFRQCLDKFLEVTGYSLERGVMVRTKESRLEKVMKELRSQLRLDTSLNHREELVEAMAEMVALATVVSPYRARIEAKLEQTMPTSSWLITLLNIWLRDTKDMPDWAQFFNLPGLCPQIRAQLIQMVDDFKSAEASKSQAQLFEAILDRMRSAKSMSAYSVDKKEDGSLAYYSGMWSQHQRTLSLYVKKFEGCDTTEIPPYTMSQLINLGNSLL